MTQLPGPARTRDAHLLAFIDYEAPRQGLLKFPKKPLSQAELSRSCASSYGMCRASCKKAELVLGNWHDRPAGTGTTNAIVITLDTCSETTSVASLVATLAFPVAGRISFSPAGTSTASSTPGPIRPSLHRSTDRSSPARLTLPSHPRRLLPFLFRRPR
jgi:hypothetical protein